ncbi:MAG: hypothetical protein LBR10_04415 [Prevotellaceae bacterium]|jgi:hypothetical protein|nr:hypothetical protein [Prevotellaceae bacterium]
MPEKDEQLETWLFGQDDSCFPDYDTNQGQKSYPDVYKDLRLKLMPIHNKVETGAMLASFYLWKKDIISTIEKSNNAGTPSNDFESLETLLNKDPTVYLNQHGKGHVNKVIAKVGEIISNFRIEEDKPTPTEIFLLLCAIQLHDVGNIFGRNNHEKSFQSEFMDISKSIITDTVTSRLIFNIARVHSGNVDGNDTKEDTISKGKLRTNGMLRGEKVREPLLAALLRFGDELADDVSRADLEGLEKGRIPPESLIYHEYSKSLKTVKIMKNEHSPTLYLYLEYFVDDSIVAKQYSKNRGDRLLIDEIFQRTIKMELERRYCMRFLGSYFLLEEIRVRIEIISKFDLKDSEIITYTLKESGYPSGDITIDYPDNTGDKVLVMLKNKGWKI